MKQLRITEVGHGTFKNKVLREDPSTETALTPHVTESLSLSGHQ